MAYRMIVLDLDGTLTNSQKVITERTKKALFEAQERGVKVVLASGRPTYGVVPLARELELGKYGSYILSFNGGRITNCKTKEVIYQRTIPSEMVPELIDLAKQYQVDFLTYEGERILSNNPNNPYVKIEAKINHMPVERVENPKEAIVVEPKVQEATHGLLSVYRSEPFFLEIMPKGVDKAASLERLLECTGIKREEMIACGDGFNDLSMIQFAGLGVAMENAQPLVKQSADFITTSNDEDGVAKVVEQFLLNA